MGSVVVVQVPRSRVVELFRPDGEGIVGVPARRPRRRYHLGLAGQSPGAAVARAAFERIRAEWRLGDQLPAGVTLTPVD